MSLFLEWVRSRPEFERLRAARQIPEGTLLERHGNDVIQEAQVEGLRWALGRSRSSRVIEIGTAKGYFGFLLHLVWGDRADLTTLDLDLEAAKSVDVLMSFMRVAWVLGDSRETLPGLLGRDWDFGFAWIDGGHAYEIALADILACMRARIPILAIDDFVWAPGIRKAIDEALAAHPAYVRVSHPFLEQDSERGIAVLQFQEKAP